jgi:hypothetical protein
VARRQRVQGAKPKGETCHVQSAGAQFSRQRAHHLALQLAEPHDEPIRHRHRPHGNEFGWPVILSPRIIIE